MTSDRAVGVVGEIASEQEFEARVLASEVPVLVAFTAEWCAPCRWVYPYLDEIVTTHGHAISVLRADVDRLPSVAAGYRVASVPTVILFMGGSEGARSVGVEPARLRKIVAEALTAGIRGPGTVPGDR